MNGVPRPDLDCTFHHSAVTAARDSVFLLLQGGDSCPAQTVPALFQGLNELIERMTKST